MINMIDIYLKMNSCERDSSNNVYYVDLSQGKREKIGRLKSAKMDKNGQLNIDFVSDKDIKFVNISTVVSRE